MDRSDDLNMTREQIIDEVAELRLRISELEKLEIERTAVTKALRESEVVKNASGKKTQMTGYVQDITERKLGDEALRNQASFMDNVINSLWDTVYIFDQETGAGIQWNKALEEISGYDYEKMKNYPPTHFYPEEEHELIGNLMKDIQEHGHAKAELTYIIADGSRIPFEYSIVPITGPDNQAWMCAIGRDLTERKNMEAQLRQSQKMDALGKLTGGIAHDYNNILGIIMGYSHLLQEALKDHPALSKYIDEIHHASERGSKLSRRLMGFSHNVQPQSDVVNANKTLIAEQDMLQKTLTPRIDLAFDFEDNLWPIYVNSGEFEDAILNLCINAMHAMESGGKLTISTSNQQLSLNEANKFDLPNGDYVLVTVSDTGEGIDSNDLNFIFDPFYTTKGEGGVGLGLCMVYGFVQRSAGSITVDSAEGSGSKFKLYFPRSTQSTIDKPKSKISSSIKLEGNETILVVDDESALVDLSKEILEANGYSVFVATNAGEALEIFKHNTIDILLSDVVMPGMDGYELASKIREINPNIKILLVSGFTGNKHAKNIDSEFVEIFLQKPFSPNELLAHIRKVLDSHKITEKKRTVLVMDDEENVLELFEITLKKLGFEAIFANNGEDAVKIYSQSLEKNQAIDIVILDMSIPGGIGGKEVAERILALNSDAKLIVSSGDTYGHGMTNYQEYGFKAMLEKDFDPKQMIKILNQVYETK